VILTSPVDIKNVLPYPQNQTSELHSIN
jgi:hypothetical protein